MAGRKIIEMRTEKKIREKILDLKTEFLEDTNKTFDLRDLKRTLKILNWVLGREWVNDRVPARHGGKGKK